MDQNDPIEIDVHNVPGVDMSDQPGDDERWQQAADATVVRPLPADERLALELDSAQQVLASRWENYLTFTTAPTPVEEYEMLTAVSNDAVLRDYVVVGLLHDWLDEHIDGVPVSLSVTPATEMLEETLGRCANGSPEKAACQAMLFTARLGQQMSRAGGEYMKALAWMFDDDVAMLVEAGGYASPEMAKYVSVLVQSVAVTKVTR